MLDPIIETIEVPCSPRKALGVFVNEMNSWWLLGKFSGSSQSGVVAKSLRIEPKQGGKIVDWPDDIVRASLEESSRERPLGHLLPDNIIYCEIQKESLAKPYQTRPGTLGVVNPCSFPEFGPLSHFGNIAALRS